MTDDNPPASGRRPGEAKSEDERLAERELMARRGKPLARAAAPVSQAIFRHILPKLGPAGASLAALQSRWPEIVGPRLAGLTRPLRLDAGKGGRTLVIEAPSAAASMIQHQSALIIERVKMGGGGQVRAIRIQQTRMAPRQAAAPAVRSRRKPLSPEKAAELEASLSRIESAEIRDALRGLGEAILSRRR